MKLIASCMCALALAACADDTEKMDPFVDADGDGIDDNDPTALRNFTLRLENVAPFTILKASVANAQPDKTEAPLAPGQVYEIRFTAGFGHRLSLMGGLGESSDWFFGTDPAGIPLYTDGVPLSGDITSQILLWDAGTEADEEPGVGPDTGLNQTQANQGEADPNTNVRLVPDVVTLASGATFTRPAVSAMIRVTVTPPTTNDRMFLVRIENVSTPDTLVTSQGNRAITIMNTLWAVHCNTNVLFEANKVAPANGLENLAEAGNAWTMSDKLRLQRGVASPLSAGIYVVHVDGTPLFSLGGPDFHYGLERVVEDGDTSALMAFLPQGLVPAESFGSFDAPVTNEQGPCHAGDAFELTFQARPGARLSLATGFVASNDWFIATPAEGMPLFNGTLPRWGEITTEFRMFDLGTAGDQELDVGLSVGTQQTAPNTGSPDGNKMVREVGRDRYDVPLTQHVRVTLTPPAK